MEKSTTKAIPYLDKKIDYMLQQRLVLLYHISMIMMRLKKERSIKMVKVTPSVHSDLIGMAKYGDSLSDVIERVVEFYKKNRQ
ncbi:MAG TPA: hypothetical protein VE818_05985 [Nitrososphaeraceae archaeon]|nr:hypothetical protein [Nitrososphaeraceae archaeon]